MDKMHCPARRITLFEGSAILCVSLVVVTCVVLYRENKKMSGELVELQRSINRLAKLPSNPEDAGEAVRRGNAAIQAGRWDLGQLYFMNAVTNAPRHVGHLKSFTSAVLENGNAPLEALERLSSVLQLAAYQVDSGDVPQVLDLVQKVENSRRKSQETPANGEGKGEQTDLDHEWEQLSRVDPVIWNDPTQLAAHLKALEDFVSDLDDQEESEMALKSKAAMELVRWSEIAQAVKQCAYIENCLSQLRDDKDLSSQRAVAIIQAAENSLPALWGVGLSSLPEDLKKKIDSFPERIQTFVEKIGEARSATLLGRIRKELAGDQSGIHGKTWQAICADMEKRLKNSQILAAQLSSAKSAEEAQNLISTKSDELRHCRNKQYVAYQHYVVQLCNTTFKEYMKYNTGLSEKDAVGLFAKYKLAEVDQALLSPEVSRLYNDIVVKLTGEMGPEKLVKTETEMSITSKKKLEDF